jgi:hypothetical protein
MDGPSRPVSSFPADQPDPVSPSTGQPDSAGAYRGVSAVGSSNAELSGMRSSGVKPSGTKSSPRSGAARRRPGLGRSDLSRSA